MTLKIENLSHTIDDGTTERVILKQLSLTLTAGETVALMGDSGCGKTTLLNLISGLEPIKQGDIIIAGTLLNGLRNKQLSDIRKNKLAIIFQQFNLLTGLNVKANIEFSAKLAHRLNTGVINHLISELGLTDLLNHMPATLSGGEMQRVAIARALAVQPKLLLADEPTGNLDAHNSHKVVALLANLAKKQNTALLMVTHSNQVAQQMDRIYQLSNGQLTAIDKIPVNETMAEI